jgi:subtilase family serine protease
MRYFEKQAKLDIVQKVSKGVSRFTGAVTGKTLERAESARHKTSIGRNPKRYIQTKDITEKAEKAQRAARGVLIGAGSVAAAAPFVLK